MVLKEVDKEIGIVIKKFEESLDSPTDVSLNSSLNNLSKVFNYWKKFLGNDKFHLLVDPLIKKAKSEKELKEKIKILRQIDYIISPFEYYLMALEELRLKSPRNCVTLCGMSIERMTRKLWPLFFNEQIPKVDTRIGKLQKELEKMHFEDGNYFCATARNIYGVRSRRGPHDVSAAEKIEAKSAIIGTLLVVYLLYLEILEKKGVKFDHLKEKIIEFCDFLIVIHPKIIAGEKGKSPPPKALALNLFQNNFFNEERTMIDALEALSSFNYTVRQSTLQNALNSLTKKGGPLIRFKKGKKLLYKQRCPPEEYLSLGGE